MDGHFGWLGWLFSSEGFMPHGHCYLWQPGTLWLNVGSDALISSAYYAIPIALYYLVRGRRTEIPYPGLLLMFAAFILLCGTTHLMEIWTVWHPDYRLAGAVKGLTGVVSVGTTLALFKVIPEAMQLQGPQQLQREVELRTAQLANVNSQLRAEVEARSRAEAQLREQDRRKDEFLATLAHELRNPLAPVRHAVKVLEQVTDPQRQRQARSIIDRQAQRMALLLDDLLDVSRITRGRLVLKPERTSLRNVVDSALETVNLAIEARGHCLTLELPPDDIQIEADPLRLSQAVSNLLTNAVKFTPRGGRISVAAQRSAFGLVISVQDTGIGFEAQRLPALFDMFSHGPDPAHGGDGGLGIGLALVRGLVELHGGRVMAHSPGPDLGATFVISLPARLILEPESDVPLQPRAAGPARALRVLVVDDNRDAASALAALLELAGHNVTQAHSGSSALQATEACRPDAVILDIGMPDMNGYEVARALRARQTGGSLVLIAVTGWGQAADKEQARAAGFDLHLTKPVAPEAIEAALEQVRGV